MINKLICWFKGHKRGKRVAGSTATEGRMHNVFACPRCGAQWSRKAAA